MHYQKAFISGWEHDLSINVFFCNVVYLMGRTKKKCIKWYNYNISVGATKTYASVYLIINASAHSFKRFTSRLIKLSFSLSICTYYLGKMSCLILFEHCQSICEEHGTSEHYKKILPTVGFDPSTPASRLQVHRSHHSTTTRLIWDGIKCPWNL